MVYVIDKSKWPLQDVKDFINEANATVEYAKRTSSSWDEFIRRKAPEMDVLQAVWRDPSAPKGYDIGTLKGAGRLMLVAQGNKGVPLRILRFRLADFEEAEVTWMVYGDGRQEFPDAKDIVDRTLREMGVLRT